jgi:ESCRT-I complex subunit VPS28
MDHPAALHRLTIGVPATVEHSSEAAEGGSEIAKWVAETTSVCPSLLATSSPPCLLLRLMEETDTIVIHYIHGCSEIESKGQRSITSLPYGINEWLFKIQGESRMGRKSKDLTLVSSLQCLIRSRANDRLITLNALKASDEITEEQSRQVCIPVTEAVFG